MAYIAPRSLEESGRVTTILQPLYAPCGPRAIFPLILHFPATPPSTVSFSIFNFFPFPFLTHFILFSCFSIPSHSASRMAGVPLFLLLLPCPFTFLSFAFMLLFPLFLFFICFTYFLFCPSLPPFYQNSSTQFSGRRLQEATEPGFHLSRSFCVICIA